MGGQLQGRILHNKKPFFKATLNIYQNLIYYWYLQILIFLPAPVLNLHNT